MGNILKYNIFSSPAAWGGLDERNPLDWHFQREEEHLMKEAQTGVSSSANQPTTEKNQVNEVTQLIRAAGAWKIEAQTGVSGSANQPTIEKN
jgi:hypothetical protein